MAARRRATPDGPRTIAAAATRLPLDNRNAIKKMIKPAADWQKEAWEYFDTVPELKFAGGWVGQMMGKVRLYAGLVLADTPTGDPVPIDAVDADGLPLVPVEIAASAKAEVARLSGAVGGQAEILREAAINLDFAGECYLVGWGEREVNAVEDGIQTTVVTPESWEIRSLDEVFEKDGETYVRDEPGTRMVGRKVDPALDTCIRIWQRHPRWSGIADSHLRALLGECRALQVLSQQILAESMSRQSAGALAIDQSLSYTRKVGEPSGESGDADDDPFMTDLTVALTEPISDPSHPASVVPMVWRVPLAAGEKIDDKIKHITFGREANEVIDRRIEKRIDRIARGINLPVEVIMGHMSTTFANAEQIDEDTFVDFLEPRVLVQVDSYTTTFLRPNLASTYPDMDPGLLRRIVVWYDAGDLVSAPDRGDEATAAYDRFEISGAAFRQSLGYSEEDAPSVEELIMRLATRKGIFTAPLTKWAIEAGFGIPVPVDVSEGGANAAPPGTADVGGGAEAIVAAGTQAAHLTYLLAEIARQNGVASTLAALGLGAPLAIDVGADPPTPRA